MAIKQSVGQLAATLLSIVRTRLELFSIEATEQRSRLLTLLGMLFGALLFLTLGIVVFSLMIGLFFWSTPYRYVALAGLALVYLLVGGWFLYRIRKNLRDEPGPFAVTIDELRRDMAVFERVSQADNGNSETASRSQS